MRHFIKYILFCVFPLGTGLMYAGQDEAPNESGRPTFLDEQHVPPPPPDSSPYQAWSDRETPPPPPPHFHRGPGEKPRHEYNYPPRSDRSYAESHARKAFKKDKKFEAPYKFSKKKNKKFRNDKKGPKNYKKSWKRDFGFNCLPPHHFLQWNDCKTEYCCEVELAGAGLENLEIFVENFELVIQAKVKRLAGCDIKGESCVKVEKKLEYRLIIPRDGDLDKIQVLLINGLLDIKLPKFKSSQIKKIFIR